MNMKIIVWYETGMDIKIVRNNVSQDKILPVRDVTLIINIHLRNKLLYCINYILISKCSPGRQDQRMGGKLRYGGLYKK